MIKRSSWSCQHCCCCCSRKNGGGSSSGARSLVYLLLAILLASSSLPSSSAGRTHAPEPLSTGVHESKDAALSLSTKHQQLDQMGDDYNDQQRHWIAEDYSPLQLEELRSGSLERRSLSGPGSSPPQCTSKCGRCYPCRPVHVPIQPGLVKTAEYYPEAWRCKCGNKLFMP